jgi:glycosyl transferase family 2
MRVVAILASYNEERFIANCIDHYIKHGVEVYLIDNESTDNTVEIAKTYLNNGLIKIDILKRDIYHTWSDILKLKEQIALQIKADWFIHADPDEIRLPPRSDMLLIDAFKEADNQGYNAVNFFEYTFVPTVEHPDHDHPDYIKTMHWYYPFCPSYPHRLNAWKKKSVKTNFLKKYFSKNKGSKANHQIGLTLSGGHRVEFEGIRCFPVDFKMKHYILLSIPHAIQQYSTRKCDPEELKMGWQGWRNCSDSSRFILPREDEVRYFVGDDELDPSNPLKEHLIYDLSRSGDDCKAENCN